MHTPKYNWCLMSKDDKNNLMIKQLHQLAEDSAPGLLHDCPYLVSMEKLSKRLFL